MPVRLLSSVSIQTQSLALRALLLLREMFTQQTQAQANRNARSKQWQPWLAVCQRKRLRFLRFSFTQRTQRKRLRLNGNRALVLISNSRVLPFQAFSQTLQSLRTFSLAILCSDSFCLSCDNYDAFQCFFCFQLITCPKYLSCRFPGVQVKTRGAPRHNNTCKRN